MVISIHTAVVPTDDNSLEQNNVKENANNFLREQYYYSDGNNITPAANNAVVTATNNINNNELGRSLMDETFPQNQQFYFPEPQDQEVVSALTPNSTAKHLLLFNIPKQCINIYYNHSFIHTLFIINLSIYIPLSN